jgi:hypothetical protein
MHKHLRKENCHTFEGTDRDGKEITKGANARVNVLGTAITGYKKVFGLVIL